MLLRASRSAESLTKEALLGRLAGSALRGAGRFAKKHWKGLLGTAVVGTAAAPMIAQGVQKSRVGMSTPYIQAQKYGLAPQMKAKMRTFGR